MTSGRKRRGSAERGRLTSSQPCRPSSPGRLRNRCDASQTADSRVNGRWSPVICRGSLLLQRLCGRASASHGPLGLVSEEVVLHLMLTKCIPILLYGLEACPLRKTDFNSLDFVINRFFMKLFQTDNIDLVKCCQSFFCFALPSAIHGRRASKFDLRYKNYSNLFCQMISSL